MEKPAPDRQRLGEVLVATGLISEPQLEQALAIQQRMHCRLGEALLQSGVLTQDQISWALARHFGLSYVDVRADSLDRTLIRSLRPGLLYQHKVIPLLRIGDQVTLAMADPTDTDAILDVSDTLGCEVESAIANTEAVLAGLDLAFSPEERRVALAQEPSAPDFPKMALHKAPRQRLGEILLDSLLITETQLDAALARQKDTSRRLGEVLIDDGVLTEDQINWALSRHLDIPYIDLTLDTVDASLLASVPRPLLDDRRVVPLMRTGQRLIVAMADPLDHQALSEIASATGCEIVISIALRAAIEAVLRALIRPKPAAIAASIPLPVDLLGGDEAPAMAPATPSAEADARKARPALSPDAVQAFKDSLRQSHLPQDEKIKVYHALLTITNARLAGGAEGERAARQQVFATLTPGGIKLALQLARQVGAREVPVVRDEEFVARHGEAGATHDADRRFIIDRRAYDRTIRSFAQQHTLNPTQIDNAVMAARAHVASGGTKQILLISKGEMELAEALTKIIRIARTRERPTVSPATPPPAPYQGPNRRATEAEVQEAINSVLAESQLDADRRDKVVRAFRLVHQTLGGTLDRAKLKELIRKGIFVGFSREEIALVDQLMRLRGYPIG